MHLAVFLGGPFPISNILAFCQEGIAKWNVVENGVEKLSVYPHRLRGSAERSSTQGSTWNFTDALTWIIYAETVYHETAEILPVSRGFLVTRKNSIIWLAELEPGLLERPLRDILKDIKLIENVPEVLRTAWEQCVYFLRMTSQVTG